MKKIIWLLLISVLLLSAASCGHAHTYEETYQFNETHHWRRSTCGHADAIRDKGTHSFGDGQSCTVCGYEKSPFSFKLSADGSCYVITKLEDNSVTSLTLPTVYGGLQVLGIEADAFSANGGKLESVVIPDTYVSIGARAFAGCTALKNVVIGKGVTTIEERAFYGCTALENLTLKEGLVNVHARAFAGCTSLTALSIPNTVKYLNEEAFAGCTAIASVFIPTGVISVDRHAFTGNTALTLIQCEASAQPSGWSSEWNGNEGATVSWGATKN